MKSGDLALIVMGLLATLIFIASSLGAYDSLSLETIGTFGVSCFVGEKTTCSYDSTCSNWGLAGTEGKCSDIERGDKDAAK